VGNYGVQNGNRRNNKCVISLASHYKLLNIIIPVPEKCGWDRKMLEAGTSNNLRPYTGKEGIRL